MKIIDGKKIQEEILENIKREVTLLPFQPVFTDVLVGEDVVSLQYVRMKGAVAERAGFRFYNATFPKDIPNHELLEEIKKLNSISNMCGIIVQLPLPSHLDTEEVLNAIHPSLDVDCLGQVRSAEFYTGNFKLGYPTALACMKILDSLDIDLKTKRVVVLGQGMLVGRPVTALLRSREIEPITVNKNTPTEEKLKIIKDADVIISAIGKGAYLKGEMLKKGVIILDAGTSELEGGVVGDVDLESIQDVASYVAPVPGGVGPVTIAMLLQNVLKVAKKMIK
jgi:methylenetetrahydrofolate dehydrogenase (NADP+) / methenyltetrahydrofolate cyclohydrolase